MAIVNTNIGASVAQAALMRNERALNTAMEQLSTGKKINSLVIMLLDWRSRLDDVSDPGLRHGNS